MLSWETYSSCRRDSSRFGPRFCWLRERNGGGRGFFFRPVIGHPTRLPPDRDPYRRPWGRFHCPSHRLIAGGAIVDSASWSIPQRNQSPPHTKALLYTGTTMSVLGHTHKNHLLKWNIYHEYVSIKLNYKSSLLSLTNQNKNTLHKIYKWWVEIFRSINALKIKVAKF